MRISLLESIGFTWFAKSPKSRDMQWNEMFGHLVRFHGEHGHTEVPRGYQAVPRLNGWITDQRETHRNGTLRADRAERLDAIGFAWRDTGEWHSLKPFVVIGAIAVSVGDDAHLVARLGE